jgi:PAS domain S-box-containing protein
MNAMAKLEKNENAMPAPLRVLIVEDTPSDAELMVLRLKSEGFLLDWQRVDTEEDYLAALEETYDLVLSDWSLPQFSGLRALHLIREREQATPFIIVSGSIGEEAAISALHQGADDYVFKDHPVRLGQAVRSALDNAQLRRERKQAEFEREAGRQALKTLSSRLEAILSAIPEIIMEVDMNKVYTWANQAGYEFFGEDVLRTKFTDYFWGEQDTSRIVQPLFDGGQEKIYVESWQRRKDGQKRLLGWWCRSLKDDKGNNAGLLSSARDLTNREAAEELQGAVYKIADAANQAVNLEELYLKVHTILKTVMPAENFYVALADAQRDTLKFPYFVDEYDRDNADTKMGNGLTEYVLHSGETLLCDEALEAELKQKGEVASVGRPSPIWLGAPLKTENETFGVMVVQHYSDAAAYGKREKNIFEYVAQQVATSLVRKVAEAHRDMQLVFTTALNEVAEVIITKDTSEDIFESTNRIIGKTLKVDRALIYDVSFEKNHITRLCEWLKQEHPDIVPTKDVYPLGLFLSPFSEIRRTQKYLASHSDAVNKHFIKDGSGKFLHEQMKIKSLIWYPFAFDEHGFYVFTLNQILESRQWTEEDIAFLGSAAKQINLALMKIKLLKEKEAFAEELQESEERNRNIFEQSVIGIGISTMDGKVVVANKAMETIMGYSTGEMGQINLADIYEDPKSRDKLIDAIAKAGTVREYGVKLKRKDGSLFEALLWISRIHIGGRDVFHTMMQDISERQELIQKMLHSQKLADLGTLAAGVAHEINSPLQVVTGSSEVLLKKLEEENLDREGLVRRVERIKENSWRIAKIVRSLLDYARSTDEELAPTSLNSIVSDTLLLVEHQIHVWSNISVITELAENLPDFTCDRNKIIQVVINLLTNARDAMPQGGKVTLCTGYDAEKERLTLTVHDDGHGIPEIVRSKIFDPFFTTKPLGQGTGLGLSIAQGIVGSHGGEIIVDSQPGKGTTFTLAFPLTRPPGEEEGDILKGRYSD